MAVELPEPLQWVLLLLAGCRWPEADEDQLRDMADHCRKAAESLKDAAQSADATVKRALEGQQGVAAEALGKYWEKYSVGKGTEQDPGYLPGAINALNGMGDMLEQVANSAETAKITIIAQLGILAFEIATAEAEAPFTAGASMLEVPAFIAASKATVSATLKVLLKEMITMAVKQAAQMAAINFLAQGIELAEGHRKSIDMKEVGMSAAGGAVGGASGHLLGAGIAKGAEKLGAEAALKTTAGKMATGAAVGVGADVITQAVTTGKVDGSSLLGSGLSGGAGAGLHAGASAAKGHFATPKAAEAPKLPGSGAGAGEHGGTPSFNKPDTSVGNSAYHGPSGDSGSSGSSGTPHTADSGSSSSGAGAGASHETSAGAGAGASKVNGLSPFGAGRGGDAPSAVGSPSAEHNAAPAPSHESAPAPAPAAAPREQAATHVQEQTAPRTESQPAAAAHESTPRQEASSPVHENVGPRSESQPAAPAQESMPRQENVAPGAEQSVPRQEASAPVHENVAPRSESQPAAPAQESMPRQESFAPGAEQSVPRQEASAPVHENVGPRSESQPAAPAQESMPRQENVAPTHESVTPRSEPLPAPPPSSPSHETVASHAASQEHNSVPLQETAVPSRESVPVSHENVPPQAAGAGHESVPRQENVASAQEPAQVSNVHEAAPRQESVAPSPESVPAAHTAPQTHESVLRQEGVTSSHATAEPTPVQQSIPRQESVNPAAAHDTSADYEPTPQNDPREPRPSGAGASSMPNLAGVLGGAGHAAGAGGGTHLDGGTRLSAGPATTRPAAGPEQVPGQIVPDGLGDTAPTANTAQSPMAGAPMAGGFTPGPVGGAGGHGGGSGASAHAAPSTTVPHQGGARPAATPNQAGPVGGTIRPGAGRTSEPSNGARPVGGTRPGSETRPVGETRPGNGNEPTTNRPDPEQVHDQLLDRQRQERQEELDRLGRTANVRDAVEQLGGTQRDISRIRPADADRLRQDLPGMTPEQRSQELANLKPENRRWLARDPKFVDALKDALPPKDFAKVASELIVHVDPRAEQAPSARLEAQQQVARLLQDPDTAAQLMKNGADVAVVPKDVRMPDVPGLHDLRGTSNNSEAGGGRGYDDMRGSGGRHSAVTEENLLGEHTTIGNSSHYADGYSTTTHEFSHTVHEYGLNGHDKQTITDVFNKKKADAEAGKPVHWPDGDTLGNYSSRNEQEYFAQATNAYLGTNHGTDPYTNVPRNNGPEWVKQHEPELYPLLKKLYGEDPSAIHDGAANPVRETTEQNATYEGFREFMEHVDGTGGTTEHAPPAAEHAPPAADHLPPLPDHLPPVPEHQPPASEPRPQTDTPSAKDQLPPPPPANTPAGHSGSAQPPAAKGSEYTHKIDGKKTFDTIDDFLGNSPEFKDARGTLEGYSRADLEDKDTDAILSQYRNEKRLHVDVLSRNADGLHQAVAKLNEEVTAAKTERDKGGHTPEQRAELQDRYEKLKAARDSAQEQTDRLAIFEHERLKGDTKRKDLADRLRDRQEAEVRVLPKTIERIRAEEKRVDELLKEAKANQAVATKSKDVHKKRVDDLELQQKKLQGDREQREKDLTAAKAAVDKKAPPRTGGTRDEGVPVPVPPPGRVTKKADPWKPFEDSYHKAFGYSEHGLMQEQPHAEKVVTRMKDGKVKLADAAVNRNHVIADYMVHKYVTAAVYKARSLDEAEHRAVSDAFGDFVTAMAPDRLRIYDTFGAQAESRLAEGSPEHAFLVRQDLAATVHDVDLRTTYGNERLADAFDSRGVTDRDSAEAAVASLEHELGRSGLDVSARGELDRLAAEVAKVNPAGPSHEQLTAVHDAMGAVEGKIKQGAVDDLALVNGITGPQKIDETVASLRAAAEHGGPLTPEQQRRLAGQLDDLAGHVEQAGRVGQAGPKADALRELGRNPGDLSTPETQQRYRDLADQLAADRADVRRSEIDRRLSELGDPTGPMVPPKAREKKPNDPFEETPAHKDLIGAQSSLATSQKAKTKSEQAANAADAAHTTAKAKADSSAKDAADHPGDAAKQQKAAKDAAAAEETGKKDTDAQKDLKQKQDAVDAAGRRLADAQQVRDRVKQLYDDQLTSSSTKSEKVLASRNAQMLFDRDLVAQQYGGMHARAGAGENHPAAMFDQALTARAEDVPALIEEITAGLSNSASNLRFGDDRANQWIQNFLDPHLIRDPELLTAVAHEQLPPETLYAPHTADLLQAVRGLEANGLVPPELRDIMAPKTQGDLDKVVKGNDPSPSSRIIADDIGVPAGHADKLPVSSSGEFANRADAAELTDDQLSRLGVEGLYRPDHVAQPTSTPDHDVVMADADSQTAHRPDTDVQMHDGTADTPNRKRRRDDSDSDAEDLPDATRRRLDNLTLGGSTPPPPPPAPTAHGTGTGTRGFGSPVAPPPPPPSSTVREGVPSGSGHHSTPPPPPPVSNHDGASGAVHETTVHESTPQDAPLHDQQPPHNQQPPLAEPLLPPRGTVEHWLVTDPAELLSKAPVSVSFADGAMQRMPELAKHQANAFVAAVEAADRHWFTVEPDRSNIGPGKNGFVLVPAWEKYRQHDPNFLEPPAGIKLPEPKEDHHYVTGSYVPYKTGRPDPNVPGAIGKTVVPMHPDPSRPGDGLVLTGGMNGCALAITDVTPHSFTVWHVQSYTSSSNLGLTADFRAGKSVTDWFGLDEYRSPEQSQLYEATNMLKYGEHGWEVISHEVIQEAGNYHIGRENRRPLNFEPPTEADRVRMTVGTYEVTAREQLERFDTAAAGVLGGLKRDNFAFGLLEQQIGEMRGHLTGQLETVTALRQPGHTLEDVRNVTQQLAADAAQNVHATNDRLLLIEGSMRTLLGEGGGPGAGAPPHSRQGKIDQLLQELHPESGGRWIDRMGEDATKQIQAHQAPPPPPPAGEGFGTPATGQHGTDQYGTGQHSTTSHDVEPMDIDSPTSTTPTTGHERVVESGGETVPREEARNDRKRGRDDDGVTIRREVEPDRPQAKRQRTPAYENSDAVMYDRGYQAVGPQHELTGQLVDYLGGASKLHPPMSNSLLQKVNPHQSPVRPAEGFQPGRDLNACFENVEAYRDTHFGRPRVSGQTLHGTVEPIPGNVLWKRHDGPALFGEGPDAVNGLLAKVKAGGPGSFATVLGAGQTGAGHAVALVHDRDGTLRWADLTDRRVVPARPGEMPYSFDPSWTLWASVADRHETNISGPHDPQFMERYSTFTRDEPLPHDTSEPMDIDDGFGAEHAKLDHTDPEAVHPEAVHPEQAPKNAVPQPSVPQSTDRTSSGDEGPDTPGLTTPATPPPSTPGGSTGGRVTGGPTRPRSASAPAEFGPRSTTTTESRPAAGQGSTPRSTSPEGAERTGPPSTSDPVHGSEAELRPSTPESVRAPEAELRPSTPESVRAPEVEFPPPGQRVLVAGDGYCLLRSVAVGAPELGGPRELQAAVGEHFRALRPEEWPAEVVANYRGNMLSRADLPAGDLLAHLPSDAREAFRGLPVDQLREIVGQHLTDNAPPPSAQERAALLRTVQDWDTRWQSTEGEMLPAATAHALGLRLRVVDHDGTTQAVFGPQDGRQVTVYRASDHYDGSEPPLSNPPVSEHVPVSEHIPVSEQLPVNDHAPETGDTSTTDHVPTTDHIPPTDDVPPTDQVPPTDRAPVVPQPDETPGPEPTPRPEALAPKPIAGTDLVVGLTGNEKAVRDKVIDVLAQAVPGDRAAARAFADAHFGPATLRPMLGALSRGEVWTAPFDGNGWSGSVKLRGEVTGSTHLRTEKIEFENGADRTVATGTSRDAQWQFNVGVQARQSRGVGDPSELVAYYHDRGQAEVNLDLGGTVARSKTSGPAEVYRSTMRLDLDFGDLRRNGEPVQGSSGGRTDRVDLDLTVAVPERPEVAPGGELRVPPQRLLDGRVGGQEIVLDLAPRGSSQGRLPVESLLDGAEAAAKREFGGHWPELREKVLAEVDFARLQRDLKSMTAGEPVSVTLTDVRGKQVGTVEISARVGELKQVGTTKETEFNIGTTVQQVRSTSAGHGHAAQLGFSAGVKAGTALIGGGGAGRLGRDHVEISGDARTSQLTSKSKVPGVLYDGTVHFDLSFNGKPVAHDPAAAHDAVTADVRLLVDRADTTDTPSETSTPVSRNAGESHEVVSPPDSVWRGGNDSGGLGETVVVRDLESTAALRAALDAKGRERFGDDWNAVRDQVMQGFSQPNLAARLTGMTRGEPLEVKIPGKEGLVVTATARVEEMTYRREDGKAELNTVNETSTFSVDRRLDARTTLEQGQLGGSVAKATKTAPGAEIGVTGAGQQRRRAGGQGRQADRVYASGKYSAPQVIYGAELRVDVHVGRPGEAGAGRPDFSEPVRVEVGMDARETVKVQAPRTEDGVIGFKRPEDTAPRPAEPTAEPTAAPTTTQTAARTEQAPYAAPSRMTGRHELNASYVVHTLSGADKVRAEVENAVRSKHGEPSEEVRQRIAASFDRVALKAQLSQLTRGGRITETVSGKTWSAEVTVTAKLGESTYHSRAEKYEFESGTRTSSGQGNLRDSRDRLNGGGQVKVKTEVVDVSGGYAYRLDRGYGRAAETVGSASNRGKHVEPAVFFDVTAPYEVKVAFKRLGLPDGVHSADVETVARVAVPARDAVPSGGAVERTTETLPKGFAEGRRLDSSAIVTDIHALPGAADGAPRRTLGESVLSQVESGWKRGGLRRKAAGQPELTRNPFGSDWAGIRGKLDAELTPDRLQSRLKAMTAGDEIVVRHGRTTVRIGAQLRDRMVHLGDAGTTEFNAGTDVQRSFAQTGSTGTGHQGTLGVATAVPVPGAPAVSVTAGLTGTGGHGHDHVETVTRGTAAGAATKAKLPGSAYAGEAELQFTITRRPWFGEQVYQRRTAAIGFEALVETGETVPAAGGAREAAAVRAPESVTVQVPPERVWETGLRDTDVLRWLGDVGGVQDLVRLRGPEYFGRSGWKEMEPVVGTVTSHSHLSALFGTATQGMEVAASIPSKRVMLGGGKGVEVGVKVVSLEHRAVDDKVELSPANATASGRTRNELTAQNAGAQGQFGVKLTGDTTNSPAVVGGAQRLWREGGGHGDSGQVISNGKFATPMARYAGHAEVEVTLFDGDRKPVKEKGVVPFAVDIPLSETVGTDVPGDRYLAFTDQQRAGEQRVTDGAWRLDEVQRLLTPNADPAARTPAEHEQLLGTVWLGRAVYDREFTASTDAGAAHVRATHQLVELGGGTSDGASALLGRLLGKADGQSPTVAEVRQVIDYVERKSAEGPVTVDDLAAGAQQGWEA
ncbi:hypothetical protein ACIQF6_02055 [Kitasatospora sp. NPDC092948]|uniref:WXG100-like domain-containing protein n=1 Tax=Kitasatospora sp. NPDC092948 TaxID=3364088 RepID=UPI0038241232